MLRAKEFAEKAGVTVRTLHFYDREGLLKPCARTESGYRLYGQAELERLEQILALRFVGLGLDQIKTLLNGPPKPLEEALRAQRAIIAEEQHRLGRVLEAIDEAQRALAAGDDQQRWKTVRNVIEAFKMKNDMSWAEKYYTPQDLEKLARKREELGPKGMEAAQRAWSELIAEVEEAAARSEDPASGRAKALAKRWSDLVAQFTGGDPSIAAGLKKLHRDQAQKPDGFKRPYSDAAADFIARASATE